MDSNRAFAAAINPTAFPGTPIETFWTSVPSAGSSDEAWVVDFYIGNTRYGPVTSAWQVRCVWTPSPAAQVSSPGAPPGRYATDFETVNDTATGLVWQRSASAQTHVWTSAQSYCQALSLGAFSSGWRVPTKKELETLVDFRSSGPTIDTTAFPNAPDDYYWTSTQYLTVTDWAWGVTFTFGVSHNSPKSDTYTVRCVHN